MRNPEARSDSSSSSASTSSINASESASRSSANEEPSEMVAELLGHEGEHLGAVHRSLGGVGLCGHGALLNWALRAPRRPATAPSYRRTGALRTDSGWSDCRAQGLGDPSLCEVVADGDGIAHGRG